MRLVLELSHVLMIVCLIGAGIPLLAPVSEAGATSPFHFSTGSPDGKLGMASRPASTGKIEIEAGDDFLLNQTATIKNATFAGLLPSSGSSIVEVNIEIYRIFPMDSANPPSMMVPNRTNSPSDISFDGRNSTFGQLTYTTTILSASFTAANSIVNGINKIPNQMTGGEGPVSGKEVLFNVTLMTPLTLPAGHYFFVPQVEMTGGEFLWLSAPQPIASGTPFTPDLQAWIRNANLDPDWLRAGTDVIGSGKFNAAFSLDGTYAATAAPEFQEPIILAVVLALIVALVYRRTRITGQLNHPLHRHVSD